MTSPGGLAAVDRYLSPKARAELADAIEAAEGNEVFFVGRRPGGDVVDEIELHCRGNRDAVPALLKVGQPGEVVIHNHPSGTLIPSAPDLELATHYGQEGVGFYIINNTADAIYVVVEPRRREERPVEEAAIRAAFSSEGGLGDAVAGYELREGQVRLATLVGEAQNRSRLLVVEAGTGTGKSMAYLLPSAMRALANGERVAVSTRTIHLQQQLLTKEIPVIQRLYPALKAALLKGRGNYLCRRKLQERRAALDENSDPEERRFLLDMGRWANKTSDGSHSDLGFVPDSDLWELVQSSTEHSLRARCPHFGECFYYSSRRRASEASVLLVNHNLLMADLALKRAGVAGGLLPRYEHVVLDEAHHLEDVATDFAGQQVTTLGLMRQLGRIKPSRGDRKGLASQLLAQIEGHLAQTEDGLRLAESLHELNETVDDVRAELRFQLEDVGRAVLGALPENRQQARDATWRLPEDLESDLPELAEALTDAVDNLARLLSRVARCVDEVKQRLGEVADEPWRRGQLQLSMDLGTVQRRLVEAAAALGAVLQPDPDLCRWIETRRDREGVPWPRFLLRPIDVASVVEDTLVSGVRSIVMTSATLTVDKSFEHFRRRTGLGAGASSKDRVDTEPIESPFDYGRQVLLGLPMDLPEPRDSGYHRAIAQVVAEAIDRAGGRTFVLFTSHRALNQVADDVSAQLGPSYNILRQRQLPRDQLLTSFRSGRRTALFGTDSFWEGVDVRGEALSCVILPRLPFRVPTEPIQVARAERIELQGGDPFRELSIPQAVLKFKQGFGRLIRHRTDRGVVLVLDTRISKKNYGRSFLRSLPAALRPLRGSREQVLEAMSDFLAAGPGLHR